MKTTILSAAFIAIASLASAEGFPNAFADFANTNDTAVARSDRNGDGSLSTGEAVSGWFQGNTANPKTNKHGRGNGVTPSISPGPATSSGGFASVGDFARNND